MKFRTRRLLVVIAALMGAASWLVLNPASYEAIFTRVDDSNAASDYDAEAVTVPDSSSVRAADVLEKLEVKGRAPKTGYARTEFYNNWPTVDGCNLRQRIIKREFGDSAVLNGCDVISGEFDEPYTGEHKVFKEKAEISKDVQIDHVVALSDAWQKGAQYMDADTRYAMATDPLNLLAVDASANEKKSDGDAATWLPSNKKFRCQYVARQVSVKYKYGLWVTSAEKEAILRVLSNCPNESAVGVE
ncbi:HNH endonuclease [Candidatus Saccharibacteria bacterium]|nr:HNH endonuclease [Candidatus Saccharibacteria bacterium]